ncbi:MAG TPA: DUF3150 domain-containing protein [Candidatus Competibacter sp.]|nr:DUF3150 domain-containing protein [Candidatus Competibacter sp.]
MQHQWFDWLSDQLVFVNLDITCWSGKKRLTPEDLGLDHSQLPPETLVSLGDKQLVDPEALKAFGSIRSAARRRCLAVGTRFLGGYAVPVAKAPALLAELDALGQRYQDARAAFLAGYNGQLAAWTQQQPLEWQKLIQDALVPAEYVGGCLSFAVQAVRFAAPDPAVITHDGLHQALTGLSDQVFQEVRQLARETLERSFQGKTAVTRRALSPLASIRDKLDGLSFLDGRFRAVVGEIDRLMAQVPTQGPIANGVLAALTQFFSLAAQPDGLRTWAESASVWEAPQEALGRLDHRAFPPASRVDAEERTEELILELIPELIPASASAPTPEPAASPLGTAAPASSADTETVAPPQAPESTVAAAADPLTLHLEQIKNLVVEVIQAADRSAEVEVIQAADRSAEDAESVPDSAPVTDDNAWFY